MNWDRIEANWKQFKGNARQEWSALTDEQLDAIAGRRNELVGRIQEAYGMSKEETEKQITEWQSRQQRRRERRQAPESRGRGSAGARGTGHRAAGAARLAHDHERHRDARAHRGDVAPSRERDKTWRSDHQALRLVNRAAEVRRIERWRSARSRPPRDRWASTMEWHRARIEPRHPLPGRTRIVAKGLAERRIGVSVS